MFPTPSEPWFGSFVRDQVQDLGALGVDVDVHTFDGRTDATVYVRASRELRSRLRRGRFDVVHAHYGLTGATAVLAHPRVPLVTTFHGSDFAGPPWQRLVSIAVARRSASIVVSAEGRRRLLAPQASVIPMGVDTGRFVPRDRREAREALGWDPSGRYAVLAGSRGNPVKRADIFDAALAALNTHLSGVSGVTLEGFSRDEVVRVLNAADVVVVTSDNEGSPVTVREALACSTPVVSVAVGDVPSVIAGLPGCAIVARSPQAIAAGIADALDVDRSDALRARAELTSRLRVAALVKELYEKLVGGTSA